jgi:polar amino acid transport system permease protein
MSLLAFEVPEWYRQALDYILTEGLRGTLIIAGESVVASAIVGVLLGTLMTIHFLPLRGLIRLYIEIWRGLPIIVTIFLIFFALPALDIRFSAFQAAAIGLSLWGSAQVAEATRGAVESIPREQHEASAALGFGWTGRHVYVIVPQALRRLLPPMVSLLVNVLQNSTLAAGRRRHNPCASDLRHLAAALLPDLVPAHAARRVPRKAADLGSAGRLTSGRGRRDRRPRAGGGVRSCPAPAGRARGCSGRSRAGRASPT